MNKTLAIVGISLGIVITIGIGIVIFSWLSINQYVSLDNPLGYGPAP